MLEHKKTAIVQSIENSIEKDLEQKPEVVFAESEDRNGSHLVKQNKSNHPKIIKAIVFLLSDVRLFNYRF